jgi:streptogramin lyase
MVTQATRGKELEMFATHRSHTIQSHFPRTNGGQRDRQTSVYGVPTGLALLVLSVNLAMAELPPGTLQPNDLLLNMCGTVAVYSGVDGSYKGDLVSRDVGPILDSWGITIGPDGNLYLCDYFAGSVKRYDGTTGVFIDDFVPSGDGGLTAPVGLTFLPDGNLYVADNWDNAVRRFRGDTGEYIDTPIPSDTPDLGFPQCLVYGADANLYISTYATNAILRYDPLTGITTTVVPPGTAGQGSARQFAFGPDGNLYVTSQETYSVKRYDGTMGNYIDDFVPEGSGGLTGCLGLAFGPDGNLYVASSGKVLRYNGATGAFIDEFVPNDSATYILFNPGVTQPGNNVIITPIPTASLTFETITAPGQTVVTPLNSDTSSLPANFQVADSTGGFSSYFDIATTSTFSGNVTLCLTYDPAQFTWDPTTNPSGPKPTLLHNVGGEWVDITTSVDVTNHQIYGQTSSFALFAIATTCYEWSGVRQPINADGSSVFKQGRTVPVKFALTGTSAGITNLEAYLSLTKITNSILGTVQEAVSTSAVDTGNRFRYSGGQYIFNLSTKDLSEGTWQLNIGLGDGVERTVNISLRN